MKKVFLLSIFVCFVLGLNAQTFEEENNNFKSFCASEDNSQYSNKLDKVLQQKHSETEKSHAEVYKFAYDAFLKRYYSRIAEAKNDYEYQRELLPLRWPVASAEVVSEVRAGAAEDFAEILKEIIDINSKRGVFNFRVSKLSPQSCQDIMASEREFLLLVSAYKYNVKLCTEGKLDNYACSEIFSPRAERMLNIVRLAVEAKDMPVAFGAARELYEILKAVNADSVKGDYEFKLAENLMI